jgi:hypothetical protein
MRISPGVRCWWNSTRHPAKTLGNERSGYAAANDQRLAFDILADLKSEATLGCRIPRRTAAPEVGLFGVI